MKSHVLFPLLGLTAASIANAQLLLTEINSDGSGGDFWELTNVGAAAVDLGGYKWIDSDRAINDAAVTIPVGTSIAAGESIVFNVSGTAAAFRTAWNIPGTVQVISGGKGLGQNDGITLFNASGSELFYLTYAANGFTLSDDGSASKGGHAGASAGSSTLVSMVWDPSFGTAEPRYTAASVGNIGAFAHSSSATTIGSPGYSGFGVAAPSVTLTLSASPSSFSESASNPASTGTITRAPGSTAPLVVSLSSSDNTEATVPATVTIPANQTSATFEITAIDDSFPDGDQNVTLTATASGATPTTGEITIQDDADVYVQRLLLTEVSSSQDASGVGDYWELTNISAEAVFLAGYSWHDSGRSASAAQGYSLPSGSSIAAGESVIFTTISPAAFRAWWGISADIQIFQTTGAPGLGKGDGVSLFDEGQNELFFFSYGVGGFTKADGSPSVSENPANPTDVEDPGHAGISAGGTQEYQSAIWDPASGTTSPRYTAADGTSLGTFQSLTGLDLGSPGITDGVPSVSITSASVTEGDSGTKIFALNVTRNDNTTAFSVEFAATGGTATSAEDFMLIPGTLTFTAGGGDTMPINITIAGDTVSEDDETIEITLSNLINSTGTTVIANAVGTATILTDDTIAAMISAPPVPTTIATGGATTLNLSVTGSPAPDIQWYRGLTGDTSNPVGTNSTSFTTPDLTETTSYWARVSNLGGTVDTETITVTVEAAATTVDLSKYVRVGRYDLPEPNRTALPPGTPAHNLLCQEASGVTYNWDTDTLFIACDGGRSITQVSKTGQLIDTMTLALRAGAPQGTDFYDPEGITYIGGGQFVFTEERDRQLVKFTYAAGTTLSREDAQTVKLGTFVDNTGTEGLSFDPLTGGYICLKEISPIGIFQTDVDFDAGTATNGSPTTENSTNLFDPALLGMSDVADVFALSNLPSFAGLPQEENLLVIGQEDARVVNISRSGVIHSTLQIVTDLGNPLDAGAQQHEGITMDRLGNIYVVNENGGGSIDFPQLWVYAPSSLANAAPTAVSVENAVTDIIENSNTASPTKLGDILVADDGLGVNELSLSGADAASFEISGTSLFLKAGIVLDFETKDSYSVTIAVDDSTIGATPDATVAFTLTVTDQEPETGPANSIIISEVAPWSSGDSPVGYDWFEVTNISSNSIDISGWKVDDSSNAFANAVPLSGITTIAAGESVIFVESKATDQAEVIASFKSNWFGTAEAPQVGTYTGSGIGLGTGGDAVNLFNASGALQARVTFGSADGSSPYQTFDNTVGINDDAISQLSEVNVNGAFVAANSAVEIGSPGFSAPGILRITEVAPWSSGNSTVGSDWFEVTNVGARAVDMTGWKVDDKSESPAAAVPMSGIASIAPGESVIYIETTDLPAKRTAFLSNWFGSNPPASLQIGSYSGGGIGLSTGGDAVNLYEPTQPTATRHASVNFDISPSAAPFTTFDNSAAEDVVPITLFSQPGVSGAFVAKGNADETGSPGTVTNPVPFTLGDWLAANNIPANGLDSDGDDLDDILEFAFGTYAGGNDNQPNETDLANGVIVSRGTPDTFSQATPNGQDFRLVFIRRKDAATTGLIYTPQFSADLIVWENGTALPTVVATDGEYEAVTIPYPFFVDGKKARFSRVGVTEAP